MSSHPHPTLEPSTRRLTTDEARDVLFRAADYTAAAAEALRQARRRLPSTDPLSQQANEILTDLQVELGAIRILAAAEAKNGSLGPDELRERMILEQETDCVIAHYWKYGLRVGSMVPSRRWYRDMARERLAAIAEGREPKCSLATPWGAAA